jgi:transglutaminase-like putative cysteine protease
VEVDGLLRPGVGDIDRGEAPHFAQWVTVQAQSASILVAAARPTYVGGPAPVRQGADGSLYPDLPLTRGQGYVVYSDRSRPGAEALRAAAGAEPADVAERYLQLPYIPQRVRGLAAEIAGRQPTAYGKARALEHWLYDNTTVTDDAEPAPLETFLLHDRSGPPERTATAMTVMLRALGVPARMAVGFLPGTRAGPGGDFVVRLSDTHAWVEVWFVGVGWQRFDPTGKAPSSPENESVWDRLWRFLRRLWPLAVAVVLGAAAWLAWRAVRWWRRQRSLPWAVRYFARLERAGAARGRPRQPHETPAEYARHLSRSVLPDPRLEEAGDLVTVAAYSQHEPVPEERAGAEEALRAATKAAPVGPLRGVHRWRTRPRPTIRKP